MPKENKERTLYRELLGQAWTMTWKYKSLWVLGLFAAVLGNGGPIDLIFRATMAVKDVALPGPITYVAAIAEILTTRTLADRTATVFVLIFFGALAIFFVFISIASANGIMYAARRFSAAGAYSLEETFSEGGKKFWPVLFLQAAEKFCTVIVFSAAAAAFMAVPRVTSILTVLAYVGLFVIFGAAVLALGFISDMASAAIVIDKLKILDAIHAAAALFKKHWLVSIEMIVLLFLISFGAFVITAIGFIMLSLPFFVLIVIGGLLGSPAFVSFVLAVGILACVAILLAMGGILACLQNAAWALLYVRLGTHGAVAKIERLFREIRMFAHARR